MTKEKIAIFPGSFDPFTIGHEAVVYKALPLFDKVFIGIGINSSKQYYFTLEQRIKFIETVFSQHKNIYVQAYNGLTVDFARSVNANYILRGLRNAADFDFECNIAQMNHELMPQVESIFIVTDPVHSAISSTIVREIFRHGGNAQQFLPNGIMPT
jgi:pantetheine-phosphate adenylyltransferase